MIVEFRSTQHLFLFVCFILKCLCNLFAQSYLSLDCPNLKNFGVMFTYVLHGGRVLNA